MSQALFVPTAINLINLEYDKLKSSLSDYFPYFCPELTNLYSDRSSGLIVVI